MIDLMVNSRFRSSGLHHECAEAQFPGNFVSESGRRYYNPTLGRWLGRDPIEEKGGLHLYGFVRNRSVNAYDVMGTFGSDMVNIHADGGPRIEEPFPVVGDRIPGVTSITDPYEIELLLGSFGRDSATRLAPFFVTGTRSSLTLGLPPASVRFPCAALKEQMDNNRNTLAGMAKNITDENVLSKIVDQFKEYAKSANPYTDFAEKLIKSGYDIGIEGLNAAGESYARKAVQQVFKEKGIFKGLRFLGVVNSAMDAAVLVGAIDDRDPESVLAGSANLALNFATANPGLGLIISGSKFVLDGQVQAAENAVALMDATGVDASAREAARNAVIGLKNLQKWENQFNELGCK